MSNHPSSYRDTSGFVFQQGGLYYRQVNKEFAEEYELLMSSGLYQELVKKNWLLPHEEIEEFPLKGEEGYKILQPEQVDFPNYPYEWCFGQLKDAALLTLGMLKTGIEYGMIMKDATPFNILFRDCQPWFIDTLSFEKYDATKPWVAYRQFCECFLCPLLLAAHFGHELIKLLQVYPEGIPISLCASMLPFGSRIRPLTALHIHLQANISKSGSTKKTDTRFSKARLLRIADHLESGITHLKIKKNNSIWKNYYTETIKNEEYLHEKEKLVSTVFEKVRPSTALDIGSNTGHFSILSGMAGIQTVAIDNDGQCINELYQQLKEKKIPRVLPLFVDITNPSPSIGWDNSEREDFIPRKKYDLVMAFAVVHHLAISKNIPFSHISAVLRALSASHVLVEFVSPNDEKAKELLERKENVSGNYSEDNFEKSFAQHFVTEMKVPFSDGLRCLYLFKGK